MIFQTAFDYSAHFLRTAADFLSCPVGVLFLGVFIMLLVIWLFNSFRH